MKRAKNLDLLSQGGILPLNSRIWFFIFLFLGTWFAFYPMFISRFAEISGDYGDSRLIWYTLEYTYQKIFQGTFPDLSFWNAPFYYPAKNTFWYTDTLLSLAPAYWFFRSFTAASVSYQLWLILCVGGLNFVSMFFFLKKIYKHSHLAASMAAFLFAFGGPRLSQLSASHPNLCPQFYSVITIYFIYLIFSESTSARTKNISVYGACIFLTAQFYSSYNLGWFLLFCLGVSGVTAGCVKSLRIPLLFTLRTHWISFLLSVGLFLILLLPLAYHSWLVVQDVGWRPFSQVHIPALSAWIYPGIDSWIYAAAAKLPLFSSLSLEGEMRLGMGFFTLPLILLGFRLGFKKNRIKKSLVLLALTSFAVVAICTQYFSMFSPWSLVYSWIPGAMGIRQVSRVGLLLLFPGAVGLAHFVDQNGLKNRLSIGVALLLLVCAFEQGKTQKSFDYPQIRSEEEKIASLVPPDCPAFALTVGPNVLRKYPEWKLQFDAMWASLARRVPTMNGYSGNFPPNWYVWSFGDPNYLHYLALWQKQMNLNIPSHCIVRWAEP